MTRSPPRHRLHALVTTALSCALLVPLLGVLLGVGCGDNEPSTTTVAGHLRTDARFTQLKSAFREAKLLESLDGPGPFTLFAPTNSAIERGGMTASDLLALPQLENLLRYHVHDGELSDAQLKRLTAITTQEGTELHIRFTLDGLLLNDGIAITSTPIIADNGIIYVLDGLLVRPLVTQTREYKSEAAMPIADNVPEMDFGRTQAVISVPDQGYIHDLRINLEIEHTDVSQLLIFLTHSETGSQVLLARRLRSPLNDIKVTLADSAMLDLSNDVVNGDDGDAQAFPESTYRPRAPLESMLGDRIMGTWVLTIFDSREGETGRLLSWSMTMTTGEKPPAPALVFDPRGTTATVLSRGFTERFTSTVKPVGGLEGPIELGGAAGELVAQPGAIEQDAFRGAVMMTVPKDAALGPREVQLSARIGDVSRILLFDTTVVEPDANGIQLAAQLPLPLLGATTGEGNDIWGWTDPVTGAEIALMGTSEGTAFIDVTTPESPVVLGTLPTASESSPWRDIKVYKDHAYIVSEAFEHGLQVFDLTQLRGITEPQTFSATALRTEFGSAHNIAINEDSGFAYVVGSDEQFCNGGLLVYDLSTPATPTPAGCFSGGVPSDKMPGPLYPLDVYTHDVQCVDYTGPDPDYQGSEICFSADQTNLGIADVSDKSNPYQVARVTYDAVGYSHQGWLTEDQQYFLLNDEFDEFQLGADTISYVWDVRDLDAPVLIGTIDNPREAIGHNTYIQGAIAYQANYTSGIRLVDISGIATATGSEIAYYDTYPDDDDGNPTSARRARASRRPSASSRPAAPLPRSAVSYDSKSQGASLQFDGAWSNYPFFESGTIVVSDINRGLFVLRRN